VVAARGAGRAQMHSWVAGRREPVRPRDVGGRPPAGTAATLGMRRCGVAAALAAWRSFLAESKFSSEEFRNLTLCSRASCNPNFRSLSKFDPGHAKFFYLGFFTFFIILGFDFSFSISNSCEQTTLPLPSLH
jgi:hypothetical protein